MIEKTSNYIKEVKTTNNPRLWLEVGIIDLANLAENTKLVELQNRITRLEGGTVASSPVQYKTPPAPVSTIHKIKEQLEEQLAKTAPQTAAQAVSEPPKTQPEIKQEGKQEPVKQDEEFSPMPVSKPSEGGDISSLWAQLLANVQSAPTRALLKQWANPIKLEPDEVILTIKNELLLNQFISGNKKKILTDAVDTLFSQTNSNIVVRLPQAGDELVKPTSTPTPKPRHIEPQPQEPQPDEEEIKEAKEEVNKPAQQAHKHSNAASNSDQVNMIIDLFDGKIIN